MKNTLKLALLPLTLVLLGWLAVRWLTRDEQETAAATPQISARSSEPTGTNRASSAPAQPALPPTVEPRAPIDPPKPASPPEPPRARLRVLDETTGEPVPFLALDASDPSGGTEDVTTDAQGIALVDPRAGTLAIQIRGEGTPQDLVQSQRPPARLKGEPITLGLTGESPQELRVPVGPTWRLQLGGAPDLDPARLRATFSSADPRKAFDKVYAAVRAGDPASGTLEAGSARDLRPWVRFGPLARLVAPGPPWRISLVSDDGLWAGRADVDANTGVQPRPLAIALEARASLSGRVLDAKSQPVAKNWVQLWPPGGTFDDPAKRPLLVLTDADGKYRFEGAPAGPHTLKTTLEGHADFAAEVELAALRAGTFDVQLTLAAGPHDGRVVGRVRSQSGSYAGEMKAALSIKNPPSLKSTKIAWEDAPDGKLGRFAFENISEDGPKVYLFGPDLWAIEPAEKTAAPFASEELLFTVLDGVPSAELSFAAQPAGSETRVPRFELQVETHLDTSPRRTTLRAENGIASVRGIAAGARYRWRLRADGFAPTWGEGLGPAEPRTEILVPRTGFGLRITVSDAAGKPLAAAVVRFDGVEVASTDADGVACVYAPQAPQKIGVAWKDWIPASSGKLKADGAWEAWQDALNVVLDPPQ